MGNTACEDAARAFYALSQSSQLEAIFLIPLQTKDFTRSRPKSYEMNILPQKYPGGGDLPAARLHQVFLFDGCCC